MPIVSGNMYAEGHLILHKYNELNILILGDISDDLKIFATQIDTLHYYLRNTVMSDVTVYLHCTNSVLDDVARQLNIIKQDVDPSDNDELTSAVLNFDFDIVFDQENKFDQKFLWSKFYEFECVKNLVELKESVENYLIGSGIAWSFTNSFWNMPLFMKYMTAPGVCMDFFSFMSECVSNKKYTDNQKEQVRYITNKIKQVEYARDILNYYIKRMRKSRRNNMIDDDYNVQLNYHLSNYYFIMAGTFDSLARLINSVYKLGLTYHGDLAVEKIKFLNLNRKKRTGFVRLFKNKKFVKWVSFLKERRNFIAHDGDMRQTPLVKAKEVLLTDTEINEIVDKQLDWKLLSRYLPENLLMAQREQAVQLAKIKNNHKVIAEKVMIIPITGGGYKIHSPLIDIDHDFERFTEVMSKALSILRR